MTSFFADETGRRNINLGGSSSASTHASIIDSAKARRLEREERKRRGENATRIQAWWRGRHALRATKMQIREVFSRDMTSIDGMRCLVLLGDDDEALDLWASHVLSQGEASLFLNSNSATRRNWLVLIRQIAAAQLRSITRRPFSAAAQPHLQIIEALLTPTTAARNLGSDGKPFIQDLVRYLSRRGLYPGLASLLVQLFERPNSKSSPVVSSILSISTSTLSAFPDTAPEFAELLVAFISSILSIPHLLSKISLQSLTALSSRIPFASLRFTLPSIANALSTTTLEQRIYLLANLYTLTQPRYAKLSPASLDAYLQICTLIMHSIPVNALDAHAAKLSKTAVGATIEAADSDLEEEEDAIHVIEVTDKPPEFPPAPALDTKVTKRLSHLPETAHITSLLAVTSSHASLRLCLVDYLLSMIVIWPGRKDKILTTVLIHTGGGLVRELYRSYVRSSPIGRDGSFSALADPNNARHWSPLLFLCSLYSQALLTMGDDEFFGTKNTTNTTSYLTRPAAAANSTSSSSMTSAAHRNPLTLDDLRSLSKQLLNVAFTLYMRDDQSNVFESHRGVGGYASVDGGGVVTHFTWEMVREGVTRCLLGIHARDSRKPFLPAGHWHVGTKTDLSSFIEAAIYEEQQLSSPSSTSSRPTRSTRSTRAGTALSKRQVAYLSPRLGVLNNIPFSIPFETRVSIFRNFIVGDMIKHDSSSNGPDSPHSLGGGVGSMTTMQNPVDLMRLGRGRRGLAVTVRRDRVSEDGFDRLADADLKGPVQVTFIDQFGGQEAGIDGGGVFKEFFTSLCKEAFDTDRGLWLATKQNELYPNPHAYATEAHSLNWYRFIGRILGKAMYEGILVDVAFAGFFLAKWLKKQSFLDDLVSLDPDLYAGLLYLKHYTGDPEDLSLNFTVAIEEFGVAKTIDLVPNGSNIAVTKENRLQYIHLVSHYRLSRQIKLQSEAFFEGLSSMIDPKWLRMFNQQELQILLGGVNSPIDIEDLEGHTQYGGLYDRNNPTISAFWKVVNEFNQEQRRSLLRFVTSCSRPPLLGFKELVPNFAIRDAGEDQHRLPTASTCVNLLKLPRYTSATVLREKLLQAINSNAGFDLS